MVLEVHEAERNLTLFSQLSYPSIISPLAGSLILELKPLKVEFGILLPTWGLALIVTLEKTIHDDSPC